MNGNVILRRFCLLAGLVGSLASVAGCTRTTAPREPGTAPAKPDLATPMRIPLIPPPVPPPADPAPGTARNEGRSGL